MIHRMHVDREKSIKYKITPFSELNYRESQSTTFDPDLHIPNELFENQKLKNVPLELVTGQGKKN